MAVLNNFTTTGPVSIAVPLTEFIAKFYSEAIAEQLREAAPMIGIHATRLGTEVLIAEREGISFAQAVQRGDFPLMERICFGMQAFLR